MMCWLVVCSGLFTKCVISVWSAAAVRTDWPAARQERAGLRLTSEHSHRESLANTDSRQRPKSTREGRNTSVCLFPCLSVTCT